MDLELMGKQVVSKKRVTDYGKVYAGKRQVNAMLDLVKQETERIDSRFLEPVSGTGFFQFERKYIYAQNEAKLFPPLIF